MKYNDFSARPQLGHLALFGLLAAGAGQARAATFTVTTNADSGTGSLRAAIVSANATTGADTIAFNLPANARVISPLSPLPPLTRPTTIDATTQPGYSTSPAVALDGSRAGSGATGLTLAYNSNIVRGLDIVNWNGNGILITGSGVSGCRVEANLIGLDGGAASAFPNSYGVFLAAGTKGNTIGGTSSSLWNYIGGNSQIGLVLQGSSNNIIEGNIIGADGQGQTAIPNAIGILLQSGSANNTIGGSTDSVRNLICGSSIAGIEMNDAGTTGNKILGNVIGMGVGGTSPIPNKTGIIVANGATSNTIGGGNGAQNVIAGNTDEGVWIFNAGTMNNKVTQNLIGVDATGKTAAGGSFGVKIESGAQANAVGPGNIISGNTAGVFITGNSSNSNTVSGNNIGLDGTGTSAIPNGVGVTIAGGAQNNIIGGLTGALSNYISGNAVSGIALLDAGTDGNVIEGNVIGADGSGSKALPNKYGINIVNGPSNNQIGGNTLAAGNVVSGNSSVGIVVQGNTSVGNIFQGNIVGANGGSSFGTKAVPNGTGMRIDQSARDTVIGGINAGEGNLISGNKGAGIDVRNTATGTIIQGNNIGTQAGGGGSLPNGTGILLESGAQFTKIGAGKDDTDRAGIAGQGNIIANNQTNVAVTGTTTFDNSIRGNEITSTSVLPIDLNNDGVTANDNKDADSGGNRLQNSPVITGVTTDTDGAHVNGTLNSTPTTSFVIDFYHNPDPATVGGAEYRGNVQVTTDANGNASFTFTDTGTLNNQIFRATATSLATGDTSEYSGVLVSNPTVSITTPATGSRLNSLSAYAGKAFDPDGISVVNAAIIRLSDGANWNGSAWVQDPSANVATTYTASSKSWAVTGTLPVASSSGAANTFLPGDYDFAAFAHDSTGAVTRTDSYVTFEYRTDYTYTGLAATCPYGDSGACATYSPGDPQLWGDARNWSPQGVPGANDTATIGPGFDVYLNTTDHHTGSITVSGLTLKNSNLHAASLAFSNATGSVNTFNFNGGFLDVLKTTINPTGKLIISPEAGPAEIANGSIINNSGAAIWNGPAAIQGDGNVTINSLTGSTFYLAGDGTPFTDANPNNVFNLASGSTFGKRAAFPSSGSSDITGWTFNFSGNVTSDTGVLRFANGNINFKDKSQLSGPSVIRLDAGSFTLAGTVTNTGHFEQTGGNLTGTGIFINASGASIRWTAGALLKLTNNAGGQWNLDGDATKEFANGAIVNNAGTMTVAGNGTVQGDGNVLLTNQSGGTLQLNSDTVFTNANPSNKFVNASGATLTKASGDPAVGSRFDWEYDSSGLSEVSSGMLALNGGGTINSTLQSDPNAILNFSGGNFTLANGAIFVGDGQSEVTGAILDLTGPVTSGTSAKARIFDMVSGTLASSGTGSFAAYGNLNWKGGAMGGTWTVPPTAQVILSGPNVKEILNGATITNNGGVFIQGSPGLLQGDGNVTFNNQNSGIFTLRGDGTFFTDANPNNVFNNGAGCFFQKETGSGTGLLNAWTFNNSGFVTCGAGTLELANGNLNFNDGGVINGASKVLLSAGSINATGNTNINANMVMTGGSIVGTGQLTLTTKGGFDWQGGSIYHLNINAGALATLTGTGTKEFINGGVINNSGSVTLAGTGTFQGDGNVVFNNLSGAIFNSNSDTQFTNANPNNKFVNGVGATFNKQKGSTSASVRMDWSYSNNGTTSVIQGVFETDGGGVAKGTFAPAASTTVRFSGSEYTLNAGAGLKGKGTIEISGGTVTAASPVDCGTAAKVNTLLVDGGNLTSSDTGGVTAYGTVNWTGGAIGGHFNVANTGILNMTGTSTKELANGAVFSTAGAATFNGTGTLQADGNVVFNNSAGGTFKVLKGSDFTNGNPGNVFNNGGTFIMGNPVAPINMGWDFTNTAKGTLSVDVNGKSSTQFDQLKVGGTANLNGTLAIVKGASYTPALNDAVKVVTAATINGTFPTVTGLSIDTAHKWSVLYNPNDVTLKVVNKTYSLSVRTFKWVNSNGTLVKSFISGTTVTVMQGSTTVATGKTGTDGFANFNNLLAGTYTVKPTFGGITFDPLSQSVTLPTSGIDGVSPNGAIAFKTYILTAKVVDGNGDDVTGVTVNLSGPATASTPTASNGVALFDNLGAGTYTLTPVAQAGFTFDKPSATVSLPTSGLTNLSPNGNVRFVRTATAPAQKAEPTPTPTPEATPQPTATPEPEPESDTPDEGSGKSF